MSKVVIEYIFAFSLLTINLSAIDIVKNNAIFHDNIQTEIASSAGSILFKEENNLIEFTNANIFENLYKSQSIHLTYNNTKYSLYYNGVDDIPNTSEIWQDNGDGIPDLGEINYNNLSHFSYKNISMHISNKINNNFRYLFKISNSNFHLNKSYGLGLDISYHNVILNKFDYRFKIYDLISLNSWDTGRLELYIPSTEFTINTTIFNSIVGMSLFLDDVDINYKVGSDIKLSDNFHLFFGKNDIYKITSGFKIKSSFFCLSYAYMIPQNNLPFNPTQQFSILIFFKQKLFDKGIPLKP